MRLKSLLNKKSIIICNILLFALVQVTQTANGSAGSENDSSVSTPVSNPAENDETENEDKRTTNRIQNTLLSAERPDKTPSNSTYLTSQIRKPRKVCPGVHIRNDLKSFEQLKGCDLIDGPLTIALVSNHSHPYEPKDYENITFPRLTEVTEYLLFFRVQGLSNLSGLFPNLAVIRGRELVSNYALIIYEMMNLQKINLPKLTDILRGSVRIESNPNLCYASTVNWEGICKHRFTPHFIKDNNAGCNNRCPDHCRPWTSKVISDPTTRIEGDVKELGAENNHSVFCWSGQACHESCTGAHGNDLPFGPNGGCCSHQCAGGCYLEGSPNQCISCRFVSQNDVCVEHCDDNSYEYKGRCIDEQACIYMAISVPQNQCGRTSDASTTNLKAIRLPGEKHGRCLANCPPGYEEDPDYRHKCRPCDRGKCRKICTSPQGSEKPFMVTNVNSLRDLAGCNVINGSLEIAMKGGKNVLHELENAFQELEEISGYLKITRSNPILTLGFLRQLRAINGSSLDRGHYSLVIIDNPNLQELFMFNHSDSNQKQLTIAGGKIFVHLNPRLCPHRIDKLKLYANVADWDERDVSIHTNGDKEACSTVKLGLSYDRGHSKAALIKLENFAAKMDDPRSLIYYLVNYREAPNGNVTEFDGKDGCNSQNDVWMTQEEAPIIGRPSSNDSSTEENQYQQVYIKVKPSTRYALYVKTYTILGGSTGAQSDIIYFKTAPDTPSHPRDMQVYAAGHDSVIISWLPPSKPNGEIRRYFVTVTRTPELEDIQNIDICDSIDNRNKIAQTIRKDEPNLNALAPPSTFSDSNNQSESAMHGSPCSKITLEASENMRLEVLSFQDTVIDIVYLKQSCLTNKNVKKRSIDYELSSSEEESIRSSFVVKSSNQPTTESSLKVDNSTKPSNRGTLPTFFDRSSGRTEVNITAVNSRPDQKLTHTITGLDHYSLYTIEIVACHGDYVWPEGARTIPLKNYNRCSLQATKQVRTLPIEEYDRVSRSTMEFYPANESISDNVVAWKKPEKPNGVVLAYRVRYRPKSGNVEVWTEGCINNTAFNRDKGFILSNINPGSYLLSVQTVSMSPGQRPWSDEIEFEIPRNYLVTPALATLLVVISLVMIGFAVASGTYYYQKKHHELAYASVNPDYMNYKPDEWEVKKENLIVGAQIGTGSFGTVYKGQLISEKGKVSCAIKTVPQTSTTKHRMDFLREANIMKEIDTYHVVKLMGVVSITTPVYVIMEFMENGDLKEFLRGQREIHQKEKKPLVDGIYLMAAQIADGMAYLASKKFVHRDLAARNCMVNEDRVVKIGDFGLTRDIYESDYYRRGTQDRLPVRWMAPESLSDNLYTSASDVWSYGIVVWEMVTFSAYPYQGLSNDDVIKRVIHGFNMSRPDNCTDKLASLMERCWHKNARDRPSFNEIVEYLLPETEGKMYPNCFYRKQKTEGDSIAQSMPEEHNNTGAESYPLLSWPSNRANGLTNGVNHVQSEMEERDH